MFADIDEEEMALGCPECSYLGQEEGRKVGFREVRKRGQDERSRVDTWSEKDVRIDGAKDRRSREIATPIIWSADRSR